MGIIKTMPDPVFDTTPVAVTITPNNQNAVPTERYVRLLVVLSSLLLLGLVFYLALRLLSLIHHTVLLFALGGLLAYALDPIVELVRGNTTIGGLIHRESPAANHKRRPRWLGVLAVFVVLFAVVSLGLFALGREAIHQGNTLSRDREKIAANANEHLEQVDTWLKTHGIPADLSGTVRHPPENVRKWEETVARDSLGIATGAGRGLVEGIVVLLITAYLLLFSEELRAATTDAAPARLRPYLSAWQDDVNRILGGFVRGQATLAFVLGAAAAVACLLLGLRFWLLIGAFVVLASLIPVAGPYIGAIPAIASALLTHGGLLSPGLRVALVIVLFFGINEFGSKILYPKLVGKALGLHEVLVLFALLAGLEAGGIVGVLFAAPLTALASVTVVQLWRVWKAEPPVSVSTTAARDGEEKAAEGVP